MSLQIIAGPAGSGKTSYIARQIADELVACRAVSAASGGILFIVPDQATFQMERKVLEDRRLTGFVDLQILSFRRLCFKVLEEAGGVSLPFITPVGRSMAIQSVLWERRKDLTVFAPMVSYPGFRETLGKTLQELSMYEVTPSAIRRSAGVPDLPYLDQKIHDLEVIFESYRDFLKDRFFDPEDYLELAAAKIPQSGLVRGAKVWIDGFSGFTPKEYKVLRAIMEAAVEVNVALCLDKRELSHKSSPASLFHPTREIFEQVMAQARDAGVAIAPAIYLGEGGEIPRFAASADMAILERAVRQDGEEFASQAIRGSVGETSATAIPALERVGSRAGEIAAATAATRPGGTAGSNSAGPGVVLVSAANPLAEVEFVAREIIRLVRDEGLRYRDITIEARDLSGYADLVSLVFRDHNVPFFLDQKRSLSHHPLAEVIRSALEVALNSFGSESVFRYLKTDLVPIEREMVDRLENYVLSHGIQGERWIAPEPWRYVRRSLMSDEKAAEAEEDAAIADAIRREAIPQLEKFYHRLKSGKDVLTARETSRAIYDLLTDLGVPRTLERWQSLAEEAGDLGEARDHAGVWDKVMEILEQADEILGEQQGDLKSYSMLVNAGLEDIRLGVIPPSLDQVLVGTLDRSRQPDCRATFLMGALLGVFPRKQSEDSVFTDSERNYLTERGVQLEPDSKLRQFHEQYLVYIALTRPSERLYISYPLGDQEGKALTPSHVIDMVKRVFPEKSEVLATIEPLGRWLDDLDFVVPARTRGIAVRRLSLLRQGTRPGAAWTEAYRWLTDADRADHSRHVLRSLSYTNKVPALEKPLVRGLYGSTLVTSVSRLERFGACPFHHFAADGLGLRERDIYRLEPADAGTFLHNAMKEFVTRVSASGPDWGALKDGETAAMVSSIVDSLVPDVRDELFMSSARYRYVASALKRILGRSASVLASQMKRGGFHPVGAEVRFGMQGGLPPYRVPLGPRDEVLLRGQIDRIDIAQRGDQVYMRIVDYKSSGRSLDLVDVWSGLSLQLLVYLVVALSNWQSIVGAGRGWGAPALLSSQGTGVTPGPLPAGALYFTLQDPIVSASGPLPQEEADKAIFRALRMSGLLVDEADVLRMMDTDSERYSDIIPVQFTSKGVSSRSIAKRDDFEALLGFVKRKVQDMCVGIFAGNIEIAPFRRGQARACQYCPYGALCSFDILVEGNRYRHIKPPAAGVWDEIRGGERRG